MAHICANILSNMSENPQRLLKIKILLAKLGLFWEQFWKASFWPVMIVGVTLLVVFSGIVGVLPLIARQALLALSAFTFLFSCRNLFHLHWPSLPDALQRIETKSGLSHRPVTAWHDDLADPGSDAQTQLIWKYHKQRLHKQFSNLKTGVPRSGWMYIDPWAGRFTLGLLLLVTVALNGQNWRQEIALFGGEKKPVITHKITLDAWISPPAYTKKPPVLLTSEAFRKTLESGDEIIVPEGSKLKVRVNGVAGFSIVLSKQLEDGGPGEVLQTYTAEPQNDAGFSETNVVLMRPVHVAVKFAEKTQSSWKIALIPDHAPVVEITQALKVTPTGGFSVPWKVSDDYGVSSVSGTLTLLSAKTKNSGKSGNHPLVYKPPVFSISLPRLNPAKAHGNAFQELTSHPWAGQQVELVLTAKDQAGQESKSQTKTFQLPERDFTKPMAKVLVEQRSKIVQAPQDKFDTVKALAAFMAWPDGLIKKSGTYLGLRSLTSHLHGAKTRPQIKKQISELWKLALVIEDGDLSATRKKLEEARRALQKALREGADPKKIAELTKNLKNALNEYMQALARQAQKNQAGNQQQQNGLQQNNREIRAADLQKMMENIENLAKSGANEAAQEMLSQLENILKNMQPGLAQKPMAPQRTPPAAKSLEKLTELMRQQQKLMDQTFKIPDQKKGNKQQKNKLGKNKQGQAQSDQLTLQQEQLKNLLGKLMEQMSKDGLPAPRSLEQAKRAMRDASRELKNGRKGPALGMQGNAMQGLRKGAEAMAKELMQQGQGEEGNFGKHTESSSNQNDPLGRPMPRNGTDFGPNENILPKTSEIMRARDIMRALRNRSNDRARPKVEQQYLQRLLDGLF